MSEQDNSELTDVNGANIPWRTFYAVLVAVNRDDRTQAISGAQLLVGYQTRPGTARIQTTAEGMREMLARGNEISTAIYDPTIHKWIAGSMAKLKTDGTLCVGSDELPTFDWIESPGFNQKHGG